MKSAPGKYTLGEGVGLTLNEDGSGTVSFTQEGLGVQMPAWKPEPMAEQPAEQEAWPIAYWFEYKSEGDHGKWVSTVSQFPPQGENFRNVRTLVFSYPSPQPLDEATEFSENK